MQTVELEPVAIDYQPLLAEVFYRPEEVARDLLKVSPSFIYAEMAAGRLASVRFGRTRRISAAEVRRFVEQAEQQSGDHA